MPTVTPTSRYVILRSLTPFDVDVTSATGDLYTLSLSAGCHCLDANIVGEITYPAGVTLSQSPFIFFLKDDLSASLAPIGAIIAWHKSFGGVTPALSANWVECNGQVLADAESVYNGLTIPNLNADPAGANSPGLARKESMFLRGALTSGTGQDDATAVNGLATANESSHTHAIDHDHSSFNSGNESSHYHLMPYWTQTVNTFLRDLNGNDAAGGTHNVIANGSSYSNCFSMYSGSGTAHNHSIDVPAFTGTSGAGSAHNHTVTSTDTETRPPNMSVVWIMRIK